VAQRLGVDEEAVVTAELFQRVAGHCPACGATSLFLGSGGYVTCSVIECPNPTAVADLLEDGETEHVVTFTEKGFTIRHPLIERVNGQLEDCPLHRYVLALSGPLVHPGRYRARRTPAETAAWSWELLP
jgi:hypothetical protein